MFALKNIILIIFYNFNILKKKITHFQMKNIFKTVSTS